MIGSFAGITFKVISNKKKKTIQTFSGFKRTTSARFANHDVIGVKPKKEFLGPGLATASFTMELSAQHGVKPMTVINKLDSYIKSGTSSRFVLGGRNMGRYVILSKSEEYEIITNRGGIVSCKIDVELEEYQ